MTFNPYVAPVAEVRDEAPATPPGPHKRPLWIGLLACAVAPAVIVTAGMVVIQGPSTGSVVGAAFMLAMAVGVAGVPTLVLGLPTLLLLRRFGLLRAGYVMMAAGLAGAAFGALVGSVDIGTGLGLVSGLGTIIGAGIPLAKPGAGD